MLYKGFTNPEAGCHHIFVRYQKTCIMRNTKKIIILALIALSFGACSQSNEAYSEDLALEENYNESESVGYTREQDLAEKDELYSSDDELSINQEVSLNGTTATGTLVWSDQQKSYVPTSKNNTAVISSPGLTNPYKDKKFMKTANLVFSVEDVYASSVAIEEILIANNGFLINSNLYSDVVRTQTFSKTPEMNVQVDEFETRNNITIRVPNQNLHATLLAIAKEIKFLDSRSISADDVGLKLLAEELEQKRNAQSAKNLQNQISNGGKLDDKVYAEQLAFERLTQKDISLLKELSIEDQIEYSTITIAIYQNRELRSQEIPNFDVYSNQFSASYGSELLGALGTGFEIVKGLFTFILSIWPVLIGLFVGGLFFKRRFLKG